LLRKSIDL